MFIYFAHFCPPGAKFDIAVCVEDVVGSRTGKVSYVLSSY